MIASNMLNSHMSGNFQLALLMKLQKTSTSQKIEDYFDQLVHQVNLLLENADLSKERIIPEAIDLALKIKKTKPLNKAFSSLSKYNEISEKDAQQLIDILRDHAD